jgi:hypothetical protein
LHLCYGVYALYRLMRKCRPGGTRENSDLNPEQI